MPMKDNMQKVSRIIIEGEPYLTFRDPGVQGMMKNGGFGHILRRLVLTDLNGLKGEFLACINFFDELLTSYSWKGNEETLYGFGETLEYSFANLLPHLPLGVEHIKEVFGHGSTCVAIEFNNKPDGFSEDRITYFIELKDSFFKTAQRIVFKNGMSKKAIRREILQVLLNELEENPDTFMRMENLQSSIPITTKELILNLRLLKEEEKVDFIMSPHSDPPKIVSVKIKSKGIKELEGDEGFPLQSNQVVKQVFGTNIEHLTTHGDNSPINISIGDIDTAFGNITKQVEEKDFEGKKEVLELVKELQEELTEKKDPQVVKGLMGKIKEKTAWVYNLVMANPVLTAYLTQLLLKNL